MSAGSYFKNMTFSAPYVFGSSAMSLGTEMSMDMEVMKQANECKNIEDIRKEIDSIDL